MGDASSDVVGQRRSMRAAAGATLLRAVVVSLCCDATRNSDRVRTHIAQFVSAARASSRIRPGLTCCYNTTGHGEKGMETGEIDTTTYRTAAPGGVGVWPS